MDFYKQLDKLRIPFGFTGKIFVLAFIGTHIPLLSFCGFVLITSSSLNEVEWTPVLLILAATLFGTGLTLYLLYQVTAPVRIANAAISGFLSSRRVDDLSHAPSDEIGGLFSNLLRTFGLVLFGERIVRERLGSTRVGEQGGNPGSAGATPLDIAELMLFRSIAEGRSVTADPALLEQLDRAEDAPRSPRPTSAVEPVSRVVHLLRQIAAEKGVDVEAIGPAVRSSGGEADRLSEVLSGCLVMLAVQAARSGHALTASMTEVDRAIEIAVANPSPDIGADAVAAVERCAKDRDALASAPAETRACAVWLVVARSLASAIGGTVSWRAMPGGGAAAVARLEA